ncbi:TPA_asm: hypothetical protein [Porphyromonas phage phage017a_JCVISC001]|uniref:Uncharacterized protein n=1 Tax=Porphyromonas phage phage017a_JCVISC001 TaxID=3154107 RepID=A0AAT9JBQ2_9CAUD
MRIQGGAWQVLGRRYLGRSPEVFFRVFDLMTTCVVRLHALPPCGICHSRS